jgi:hypothetical protein
MQCGKTYLARHLIEARADYERVLVTGPPEFYNPWTGHWQNGLYYLCPPQELGAELRALASTASSFSVPSRVAVVLEDVVPLPQLRSALADCASVAENAAIILDSYIIVQYTRDIHALRLDDALDRFVMFPANHRSSMTSATLRRLDPTCVITDSQLASVRACLLPHDALLLDMASADTPYLIRGPEFALRAEA